MYKLEDFTIKYKGEVLFPVMIDYQITFDGLNEGTTEPREAVFIKIMYVDTKDNKLKMIEESSDEFEFILKR